MTPGEQVKALRAGRIDLALLGNPCADLDREFMVTVLTRIPFQAVLPDNHLLALRKRIALSELEGEPFIGFAEETFPGRNDAIWSRTNEELGAIVKDGLERSGLPVRSPVLDVVVKRLPAAYPIYRIGYEARFETVDRWVEGIDGVLSFGRQGLYAHDNTHHALFMARAAVDCLSSDEFDRTAWRRYRRIFDTHVVED